ncbi:MULTISPECIES: hypothetical protein [unclassified Pseudoalteromonas]|uniref:hypothetical protein n=1 Tax=unclassified Pseudoalteromonas TaxID=194690 RepID=UPI002096E19E|nr:hypothetical protein [Pseudoalteromonas sp. XMcav2-N]MCO7190327.1 hypothetical protein [Pseudoalteromonas sp. XMcav2-N]
MPVARKSQVSLVDSKYYHCIYRYVPLLTPTSNTYSLLNVKIKRHPFQNLSTILSASMLFICSKDKDESYANGTEKPGQLS